MRRFRTTLIGACAVAVMALVQVSSAAGPATSRYYSYYFKEKRPLSLDVTRVAVLQPDPARQKDMVKTLAANGFAADALEPWPIRGWSIAAAPQQVRTPEAVEQLTGRLAGKNVFQFVSPVFIDGLGGPVVPTRDLFVAFNNDVPAVQAEKILITSGAGAIIERNYAHMAGVFRLRSTSRNGFDVLAAVNALAERADVKFAETDMIFTGRGESIPNDEFFPQLWGLHNIHQVVSCPGGSVVTTFDMDMDAPEAWDLTTGEPSITVVVIDTGVQQNHPDINQIPGTDVTTDPASQHTGGPVNQYDNHGTKVAGCVSAIINNGIGVVGVAPGCKVASVRTFITMDSQGFWFSQPSWTVAALSWAESINSRVTNNSNFYGFGGVGGTAIVTQKYADTYAAGMIHFSIAGNEGGLILSYPGSLPSVNAVASINRDGTLASTSSHGPGLDFAAPGTQIMTTDRTGAAGSSSGDYVCTSGTSFASPYVAGIAALVLSVNPSLSADQLVAILQRTATDLGPPGYDTSFGWGLPNAQRAIQEATATTIGDLNGDGIVNSVDLGILLASWSIPASAAGCAGSIPCPADLNHDGVVNSLDLGVLLAAWTL